MLPRRGGSSAQAPEASIQALESAGGPQETSDYDGSAAMLLTSSTADVESAPPAEVTSPPPPPPRFQGLKSFLTKFVSSVKKITLQSLGFLKWAAIIVFLYFLSEIGSFAGLPATQMLFAAIFGIILALSGQVHLVIPKQTQLGTQALIGVVMGSYMQLSQLQALGPLIVPIIFLTAVTLFLSIATGWILSRFVPGLGVSTAILGTVAGGSAAVVSAAEDLKADCRVVAFMQYFRVIIIVASTPFLVSWVFGAVPTGDSHAMNLTANFFEHYRCPHDDRYFCILTGRGDWLAGLCIAMFLCVAGIKIAKMLRIPSPATLGPMILTAIVTSLEISHGFFPDGMLKEVLFILVGLDVGLRFTRRSLFEVWKMFPAICVATVALAVVSAAIPAFVAVLLHVPQTDMYLATTPGGINAVIATASSVDSNMPLVASTQSLRLIMLVFLLPLLAKQLAKTLPPPEQSQESPTPS